MPCDSRQRRAAQGSVSCGLWTGSVGRLPLLGSELYNKADTAPCPVGEALCRVWGLVGCGVHSAGWVLSEAQQVRTVIQEGEGEGVNGCIRAVYVMPRGMLVRCRVG